MCDLRINLRTAVPPYRSKHVAGALKGNFPIQVTSSISDLECNVFVDAAKYRFPNALLIVTSRRRSI